MRRLASALLLAIALPARAGAPAHPALLADLPDDVQAKIAAAGRLSPAETLERVIAAGGGFKFRGAGLTAFTDRRWFEAPSVEGDGAPLLEIRRWPGDTVVAFYELPSDESEPAARLPGLALSSRRPDAGGWSLREGTLTLQAGDRPVLWLEKREGSRRIGALGLPGDGGLGPAAIADLKDAIVFVVQHVDVAAEGAVAARSIVAPAALEPMEASDESKAGWRVFQGPGFTLGLPPGLLAMRLDIGVVPSRPVRSSTAWLRGRFIDRDGGLVVVGDGKRAGYVSSLNDPEEEWTAGVEAPLGAPGADKLDEAPLDDPVRAWTGASRATVSHWKEEGFDGDWLVFRLLFPGRGVEIGLPVVSRWRSLALFWIPVTWRREGEPPAPPPIDPAASRGIRFQRLSGEERKHVPQLEGTLFVADLRLDIPRGWSPVANMGSRDGFPVTLVDMRGQEAGRVQRFPAGDPELDVAARPGWTASEHPGAQRAAALWTHTKGACLIVAKDGHGYLLVPGALDADATKAWERLRDSAAITKASRR